MPNLDPVNFPSPSSIGSAIEVTVASIASPTELNSRAAVQGDLILARTTEAGTGTQTLYYADTTSDAESLPYIVSSATSGVKFIAVGGRYSNQENTSASGFTGPHMRALSSSGLLLENSNGDDVALFGAGPGTGVTFYGGIIGDGLTASRLLRTGASKNLESNAVLTSTRVLYADANGWPTDSANLTFSGTQLALGTGATAGINIAATSGTTLAVQSTATSQTAYTSEAMFTAGGHGIGRDLVMGANSGTDPQKTLRVYGGNTSADRAPVISLFRSGNSEMVAGQVAGAFYLGSGGGIANFNDATIQAYAGLSLSATVLAVQSAISTTFANTTDSTSKDTGSIVTEGGIGAEKSIVAGGNLFAAQAVHAGVSSTATAAGTTTLTSSSRRTQIFTGTTTQTLQLPAANVFGAGVAVEYVVINRSTGTVTAQRAGSDTFDGGGTTDAILTNTTRYYISNGSNQWHTIA